MDLVDLDPRVQTILPCLNLLFHLPSTDKVQAWFLVLVLTILLVRLLASILGYKIWQICLQICQLKVSEGLLACHQVMQVEV